MEANEIKELLIACIKVVQETSGRPFPNELGDDLCPLDELEDFDSMNALEVETLLGETLGINIDKHTFYSDGGKNRHNIEEIVENILDLMGL